MCFKCLCGGTLSYVVHTSRVLAATGLLVMFGCDVLAFTREASAGGHLGLLLNITRTHTHPVSIIFWEFFLV